MRLWGVSVPESERLAYRIHLVGTANSQFYGKVLYLLVLYGMAHNDLQRANSRNCSTDPDEQYFIDELQAHLLEEANGASKFKERLCKSESHLTSHNIELLSKLEQLSWRRYFSTRRR